MLPKPQCRLGVGLLIYIYLVEFLTFSNTFCNTVLPRKFLTKILTFSNTFCITLLSYKYGVENSSLSITICNTGLYIRKRREARRVPCYCISPCSTNLSFFSFSIFFSVIIRRRQQVELCSHIGLEVL